TCRTTPVDGLSANQAYCAAQNADCQGACYAAYNVCRTTRGPDGLSANQAQCAAEYAGCLGENPFGTSGLVSTFIPYSATASSSMMPTTSTYTEKTTYTTIFTTDYVTVCPTPTVVTINKQTITVTASTTLTVPCPTTQVKTDTITKSVVMTPSPVPASSKPAPPASSMPAPPASSMPASSMPVAPASTMPASGNTCAPAQTVTVTQYVTVSKQQETSMAPSSAPASSMPQSSAPASSMKPSSAASSAVMSSKPASSAPASSAPASSAPAPSASATGKCPLDLKAGAYEYPHALRVNGVNGYNVTINKDTKTDVGFDIPQGDSGKTCSTYFSLPKASDLATSGYSLSGTGMINVSKDGKVIYSFAPQPGNAYLIESGACAAGKFVTYTFSTADSVDVNLFNDYNPCALGAFVTVA
ncbi:hypothetical protein KCU60_g6578, partial [Aureobasidium melanogenum]